MDAAWQADEPIGLTFADGNTALAVRSDRRAVASLVRSLGLAVGRPVLIVAGAADTLDPALERLVRPLLEFGMIPALETMEAAIVDGGTASGIMELVGQAVAASRSPIPLVGVAPIGRVSLPNDDRALLSRTALDSRHPRFVLSEGDEWGDETGTLFEVAAEMSSGRRAALLLAGGGPGALDEVLHAVRADMPVIVLAGSGGSADAIAEALAATKGRVRVAARATPLDEIVADGNVQVVPIDADPALLERHVSRELAEDETLRWAWTQYHAVTVAARRQQRQFHNQQGLLLTLGVLATALVTISAAVSAATQLPGRSAFAEPIRLAVVLVPILLTALLAISARFRPGPRWILLRGTAESIKREIYRYRARAGPYARSRTHREPPEVKLAAAIGQALAALMRTEVNLSSLEAPGDGADVARRHAAKGDDGMSSLSAARYVQFRVDDQIAFYRRRVRDTERLLFRVRLATVAIGALGTFLAAVGVPLAVAVTTAVAGAYATYLEALQLETTIMLYNQAATDLTAIRGWWIALPPERTIIPTTVDRLVDHTERIVRAEQSGWVQEMQDAITQLRLDEAAEARGDDRELELGEARIAGQPAGRLRSPATGSASRSRPARADVPGGTEQLTPPPATRP